MSRAHAFRLPDYARYAFEEVRQLQLEVWFEEGTRWIRLVVMRDLLGNDSPYVVRVYTEGLKMGDPWVEFEEGAYPWFRGTTPEEAVQNCLLQLEERGPIRARHGVQA